MIELRKIDEDNVWKVTQLSVHKEQEHFVASNTNSIIEAYVTITAGGVALPFGMYHEDCLVGFVMFGYGSLGDEDEPKIATNNYCIWRFMIDQNFQRQGLGRKALNAALDYLRTMPCGEAKHCWLSYEADNMVAKALYSSVGFEENGELCGDEVVSVFQLT